MIKLKSPAKINLYLNVLRKRKDGYHNIETLFERVSLSDDIALSLRSDGITVKCTDSRVPQDENNIACKAAAAFKKKFRVDKGVHIYIKKRIPVGAGLGGGSSNAATVLLGLRELWGVDASLKDLQRIGRKLGADVGFFLSSSPVAIGVQKGDILKPLNRMMGLWHILIHPKASVSTAWAYGEIETSLTRGYGGAKILSDHLKSGGYEFLPDLIYNSFEEIIAGKIKELSRLKRRLLHLGIEDVFMSGSGPTLYTIHSSRQEAFSFYKKIHNRLGGLGSRVSLVHTI